MSIHQHLSRMEVRRRLVHQLYPWLQIHIIMNLHTYYSTFPRKKLSMQKHVLSLNSIFSKNNPYLIWISNWWKLAKTLVMECHLYHVCVPTHVYTCIQTYVHEYMFEYTIWVSKQKKRKETYHMCFDLYVHVWEVRVSESRIPTINSDRTLKSPKYWWPKMSTIIELIFSTTPHS